MSPFQALRTTVIPACFVAVGILALLVSGSRIRAAPLGATAYQTSRIEGDTFPKTLIDPMGEAQSLAAPPRRIASVVLSADEILTQIVEPDRIIAVTSFADDPNFSSCFDRVPPEAARITGGAETILALEPDLVFVAAYTRIETVRFLTAIGIPVVRFGQFGSFDDVIANVRTIGDAVGEEAKADALIADVQSRIHAIEQRVAGLPEPRVLFYSTGGYTVGPGSVMDEMIHRAGGRNVVRETGLTGNAPISLELAVALEPDVVFMLSWGLESDETQVRTLLGHSAWQTVPAVQNERVYPLPSGTVNSVSHHAVEGLEVIARALHPEAFAT